MRWTNRITQHPAMIRPAQSASINVNAARVAAAIVVIMASVSPTSSQTLV
jgi:hypothetical protein